MEITLRTNGAARTVRVSEGSGGAAVVELIGRKPAARDLERLTAAVRHVLRLDEDLSDFYGLAAADPDLAWTGKGGGRVVQRGVGFEDVDRQESPAVLAGSNNERRTFARGAE